MGLWKPTGRIDKVDLGKDFFLVRFSAQEDLETVLKKGPWFIGEHFLSIHKWEANFKPLEALITLVAVWVCLNELPIEYYDARVLRQIGQALGNVLRVDTHTATEARGKYARICVQVDIGKLPVFHQKKPLLRPTRKTRKRSSTRKPKPLRLLRLPAGSKSSDGKRKARSKLDLSVELEPNSVGNKVSGLMGSGSSRITQAKLSIGPSMKFNQGLTLAKLVATLVKGKKDFARGRASPISSGSAAPSKEKTPAPHSSHAEKLLSTVDWSSSITKIQGYSNGGFQFQNKSGREVGDQIGGEDCGNSFSGHRRSLSSPHTHKMGWFNAKLRKARKLIFPLTLRSAIMGLLPLTNLAWGMMTNPWWSFVSNTPGQEEEIALVWKTIPQIAPTPMLCDVNPLESLTARRMLENQAIATNFFGNWQATKILQVFQPVTEFLIHWTTIKKLMGVLEHCVTLMPGNDQMVEVGCIEGFLY
nr:uncharacterized protein CFP56_41048 [Quercus suber]